MNQTTPSNAGWKTLIKVGGLAALIAGAIFRRNLGTELALFSPQSQPEAVADWFALLQDDRFLGLAYLNLFDLFNYALLGLVFLALYAVMRQENRSAMAVATFLGLLGIAVTFATNTAFSMLALSQQYAAAATEAHRAPLIAAGQAMLALNRFCLPGAHPGAGGYASLGLVAAGGLTASVVMLRSQAFTRTTAIVGILAAALDLSYCLAYAVLPEVDSELTSVLFIPAAGLLLMVWHLLVARGLYQHRGVTLGYPTWIFLLVLVPVLPVLAAAGLVWLSALIVLVAMLLGWVPLMPEDSPLRKGLRWILLAGGALIVVGILLLLQG